LSRTATGRTTSPQLTRRTLALGAAGLALATASAAMAAGPLARFTDASGGPERLDHRAFDSLLARWTSPREGIVRVDYRGWRAATADRAALAAYIARLSGVDPVRLTRSEQFAFWANLYNAVTLETVLTAWPVRSIRDIRPSLLAIGPWKAKAVTVSGLALSLDDIETGILRTGWRDPRVHYAINCASLGCPNLPNPAWGGADLSARLDAAARAYINHPRGVRFEGEKLVVSSIYRWFRADFGGDDRAIIAHLARYAAPGLKARLSRAAHIDADAYDWSINGLDGGV
jgi:hypothetical protein